jgi:hypothetical protein
VSDFCSESKVRKARRDHRCTYCGEGIASGETYVFQKGNYDDRWYESKMHHECFDDLKTSGDDEYMPYSNERPSHRKSNDT